MNILIEVLPLVFSLIMGAYTTHKKQEADDLHRERVYALKATESARRDQSKGTSKSRKFIVQSVIGSMFLFPMVLTVMNFYGASHCSQIIIDEITKVAHPICTFEPVATYIPEELKTGGLLSLLWSRNEVIYVPINGFLLTPIHYLMTQVIVGFYFGSSAMRR